jgi:DNA-binding transcriptional ArsR family regulator
VDAVADRVADRADAARSRPAGSGLTQPTISHHLKVLVDAGIFTRDKRGVWAYYALVPAALDALSAVLSPPS